MNIFDNKTIDQTSFSWLNLLGMSKNVPVEVGTATSAAHAVRLDQTNLQGAAFSAYLPIADQSVTSATWTKVNLSAEEFDAAGDFDATTNYRHTPTIAGYYQYSFAVQGNGATVSAVGSGIYKNGSLYKQGVYIPIASVAISSGSALVYMNGTTDYVELHGYVAGTTVVFNYGSICTYLTGCLVRR